MKTLRLLSVLGFVALVSASTVPMAAEPTTAVRAESNAAQHAMDALQKVLSAYSAADQGTLESLIDPKMIGYARVVDAVRDSGLAQKHVQLTLSDTRTQVADDAVFIQTHWEKRYVSLPARASTLKSGKCTFVMRPNASAWTLSAVSGDNPFGAE